MLHAVINYLSQIILCFIKAIQLEQRLKERLQLQHFRLVLQIASNTSDPGNS